MEHVEHRIKLDLMKAGLQGQVIVKKADSDSRKINIFLSSAAGPYNMKDITSAILRAEKPDGKVMFNSCTVCEDRLEYIITIQTIAATGTVTCEITLMSSTGQVLVTAAGLSLPSEFDHESTPSSLTLGVNVVPSFSAAAFFIASSSAVYSFVDSISVSE